MGDEILATRSDNIFKILQNAPCKRLSVDDIRRKLVLDFDDSPVKLEGPTIYATVRGDNNTRLSNGKAKRFNYSGDSSEVSGYVSLAESEATIDIEDKPIYLEVRTNVNKVEENNDTVKSLAYEQEIQTLHIDDKMMDLVYKAVDIAVKYEAVSQGIRKMPITGEVGEVLICKQLGLKLIADFLAAGIDAIDESGLKVQIKTRRESQDEPKGNNVRIGRFSEHYFDYALLGILDKQYRLREVWRAEYADLKPIIDGEKRRNPSMSSFKRVAKRIM